MITTVFQLEDYCDKLAKSGTEHGEQVAFFAWLAVMKQWGEEPLANLAFAIPNGGKRDKITAGKLKAEGVKPGVPDICYPVPLGGSNSLWLELKVDRNKASDKQGDWHIDLRACGHAVATCWGWRAAAQAFRDYSEGGPVNEEYK